jgi:membrane-associated phospholipid phosphatase
LGLSALIATAFVHVSLTARAEEQRRRLVFDDRYRPFEWPDAAQTGLTLGAYAYLEFGLKYPKNGHWQEPVLFDTAVRNLLLARSRQGRDTAALVSDVTWYVPMLLPWAESTLLPLLTDRGNYQTAFQLTAMNAQAASVVALLTRAGHKLLARGRPDLEPCRRDRNYSGTCFGGEFASFPSGHVSAAMLGAGLSCAHHGYLPLLGGGSAEVGVCAVATTLGFVNGVARISADRHYATDVIAGAALGWGVGYAMPVLLHYRWYSRATAGGWSVAPWASSDTLGLFAHGLW